MHHCLLIGIKHQGSRGEWFHLGNHFLLLAMSTISLARSTISSASSNNTNKWNSTLGWDPSLKQVGPTFFGFSVIDHLAISLNVVAVTIISSGISLSLSTNRLCAASIDLRPSRIWRVYISSSSSWPSPEHRLIAGCTV